MENEKITQFITSLRWMSSLLRHRAPDKNLHVLLTNPVEKTSSGIQIKLSIVELLTSPLVYCSTYQCIEHTFGDLDTQTFWPLIHVLARHGIHLVDENDASINHSVLSSAKPFKEMAHCVLIEGLMEHYTFTHAPIGNVVKEIRKISGLSASKELPLSTEETLLLWINKSAQAAHSRQQQTIHEVLQEDHPLRRRNTRLKLMRDVNGMEVPHKASNVCDLYDGQGVAATLIYYDQKDLCWNDFHFSHQPLPHEQSLSNLVNIKSYCDTNLPMVDMHISPQDWTTNPEALRTNITAFLACLFNYIESNVTEVTKKDKMSVPISSISCVSVPLKGLSHKHKISTKSPHTKRTTSNSSTKSSVHDSNKLFINPTNLSSISLTTLPSQNSSSKIETPLDTHLGVSLGNKSSGSLKSLSASTINVSTSSTSSNTDLVTSGRVRLKAQKTLFPGATRNVNSIVQKSLLSSFNTSKSQTSDISCQDHLEDTTHKPNAHVGDSIKSSVNIRDTKLISASVDGLGIREQMKQLTVQRQKGLAYNGDTVHFPSGLNPRSKDTTLDDTILSEPSKDVHVPLDSTILSQVPNQNGHMISLHHVGSNLDTTEPQQYKPAKSIIHSVPVQDGHMVPMIPVQDGHMVPMILVQDGHMVPMIPVQDGHMVPMIYSVPVQDGRMVPMIHSVPVQDSRMVPMIHSVPVQDGRMVPMIHSNLKDNNPCRDTIPSTVTSHTSTVTSHTSIITSQITESSTKDPLSSAVPNPPIKSKVVQHETNRQQDRVDHSIPKITTQEKESGCKQPSIPPPCYIDLNQLQDRMKGLNIPSHSTTEQCKEVECKPEHMNTNTLTAFLSSQIETDIEKLYTCLAELQGRETVELPPSSKGIETSKSEEVVGCENQEGIQDKGSKMVESESSESFLHGPLFLRVFPSTPSPPPSKDFETDCDALLLRVKFRSKIKEIKAKMEEAKSKQNLRNEALRKRVFLESQSNLISSATQIKDSPSNTNSILNDLRLNKDESDLEGVLKLSSIDSVSVTCSDYNMGATMRKPSDEVPTQKPKSSGTMSKPFNTESLHNEGSKFNSKTIIISRKEARGERKERRNILGSEKEITKRGEKGEDEERKMRRREEIKARLEERDKERRTFTEERKRKEKVSNQQNERLRRDNIGDKTVVLKPHSDRLKVNPPISSAHSKTNKKLIRNALCYVCLAGEVNITLKQKALAELEFSGASHFLVLFRNTLGLKFKGLYTYVPNDKHVARIFGTGPKLIQDSMVKEMYKYNSGTKSFQSIPSRSFSISIDAITIQDPYWISKKSKSSGR